MSKILDKIKNFGRSLTSMFQENQDDDISYLNPDTEEGKKLLDEMKPFVDRMNALEEERNKEQKQRVARIRNLREGDVSEPEQSLEGQDVRIQPTPVISRGKGVQNATKTTQRQNSKDIDEREK